jgi:hypothetical protein
MTPLAPRILAGAGEVKGKGSGGCQCLRGQLLVLVVDDRRDFFGNSG